MLKTFASALDSLFKGTSAEFISASLPNFTWPFQKLSLDRKAATYQDLVDRYSSWVYVCASRNASAVSQVPLELFKLKGTPGKPGKEVGQIRFKDLQERAWFQQKGFTSEDVELITEHPFLDLLYNANPFENGAEMLEKLVLYLELTGNAYWYVVDTFGGIPTELWVMPSQWVRIVPDPVMFIKEYLYGPFTDQNRVSFDPKEVIHFKYPNPRDQFYGMGPLEASIDAVDTSLSFTRYEQNLLQNNARPDVVLSTEGSLGDKELARMRVDWNKLYRGIRNAGKVAILTGGLKPVDFNFTPREMSYLAGRKVSRDEIANVFGVPKSMVDTEDVNKANAQSGEYVYAKYTLLPKLRRIEQKFNERLVSRWGPQYFCAFQNPVPEDKALRLDELERKITIGYSTINEQRAIDNLEPVAWGDTPNVGVIHGDTPAGGNSAPPIAGPADVTPPAEPVKPKKLIEFFDESGQKMEIVIKPDPLTEELEFDSPDDESWKLKFAGIKDANGALWPSPVNRLSKALAPQLLGLWDNLYEQIPQDWLAYLYQSNIDAYGRRPVVDHKDPSLEEEDALVQTIFNAISQFLDGDANALKTLVVPKLAAARAEGFNIEVRRAMREFGLGKAEFTRAADPAAILWAQNYSSTMVTEVTRETQKAIAEIIANGIRDMRGVQGTARDLREMIGLNQARVRSVEKFRRDLIKRGIEGDSLNGKIERFSKKQLRLRSELIANNEINVSVSTAQREKALRLGRDQKEWLTVGDDRVSQEICEPNESYGRVDMEFVYTHGGETTPGHVRCRCSCSFFGGTRDEIRAALLR